MTQCLERVLASDYAKMEIIVFDDSSRDDTSVLIRSFAHAGVRFVPGTDLPDGWLGKNHALEVMAREASGTYVVFMDVDTFIQSTTISQLVSYITTEKLDMLSVIPGRNDNWRASVLFGHLRYFWELILSTPSAPAVSSSLWMIRRITLLDRFGGFEKVRSSVAPEAALASVLTTKAYHCLIGISSLGVSYEKKWHSQLETSRRLLYPMVGGRPLTGMVAVLFLIVLSSPSVLLMSTPLTSWGALQLAGLWLTTLSIIMYMMYTHRLWRRGWFVGGFLWPLVVLQELALLTSSVISYARHTVTWKGRIVTDQSQASTAYVIDE